MSIRRFKTKMRKSSFFSNGGCSGFFGTQNKITHGVQTESYNSEEEKIANEAIPLKYSDFSPFFSPAYLQTNSSELLQKEKPGYGNGNEDEHELAPLGTIGDNHDLTALRFAGNADLEAVYDNEKLLWSGDSGRAVALMQQALIDAGFPLPRFGVDGIFGNETRQALMNFQLASSLPDLGILDQHTLSALNAFFTRRASTLAASASTAQPASVPAITSETIVSAPDGTPDNRKTVGVGERVKYTAGAAGTWTVSDGHIIGLNTGSDIVWEAPPIASDPTITITTSGVSQSISMHVISPLSMDMFAFNNDNIPAGTAGACMHIDIVIRPANVSFGRIQIREDSGPGVSVTGLFTRYSAAQLNHDANPDFHPVNDDNNDVTDHAALHTIAPPYSFGAYAWVIPNRYKIDGEPDSAGRFFVSTRQNFYIYANGMVIITKENAAVVRLLDNKVMM